MTAVTLFHPMTERRDSGWLGLLAMGRTFLVLAALAFFAGFGGYLILGPPHVLAAGPTLQPSAAAAPTAIPADEGVAPDWNPPKPV
jgi:hypothetical protein